MRIFKPELLGLGSWDSLLVFIGYRGGLKAYRMPKVHLIPQNTSNCFLRPLAGPGNMDIGQTDAGLVVVVMTGRVNLLLPSCLAV